MATPHRILWAAGACAFAGGHDAFVLIDDYGKTHTVAIIGKEIS